MLQTKKNNLSSMAVIRGPIKSRYNTDLNGDLQFGTSTLNVQIGVHDFVTTSPQARSRTSLNTQLRTQENDEANKVYEDYSRLPNYE